MERVEDWPMELSKFLESCEKAKFRYGKHDCIRFAAKALLAMTGVDISDGVPAYKDKEGAAQVIDDLYGGDSDNVFSNALGRPGTNCRLAGRGDIVRATYSGEKTYGVVDDSGKFACFPMMTGFIRVPVFRCQIYWKV